MNEKIDKRKLRRPLDRFNLFSLQEGRTRYIAIENAGDLHNEMKCITNTAKHYVNKGYMRYLVFSVAVITHDEVGILYGLKKGHSNE